MEIMKTLCGYITYLCFQNVKVILVMFFHTVNKLVNFSYQLKLHTRVTLISVGEQSLSCPGDQLSGKCTMIHLYIINACNYLSLVAESGHMFRMGGNIQYVDKC